MSIVSGQNIKVKKDKVWIDGIHTLNYHGSLNGTTFKTVEGKELFFLSHHTETQTLPAYTKLIFLTQSKMVTNTQVVFTRKILIKTLLDEGILVNGNVVEEKIDNFILKYNEPLPTKNVIVVERE